MATFKTDLRDIYFNLFNILEVEKHREDIDLSDIKGIVEEFNKFIENEVYPTRQRGDEEGVKLIDGKVIVPECFKKPHQSFYENGWYGLGLPEEIGGMPVPEAVSFACTSIANGANVSWSMYFGLSRGAMNVIEAVGSQKQKDLFIPKMMSGQWGGTMCLTEAGAGSDVGAASTTASLMEDGRYKMKGVKTFISSGESDLYENNIHLVLARTNDAPEGTKGLSLFIVPRFKIDDDTKISNDVICSKIEEKMGLHGQATCELTFGNSGDCVGELIGNEFDGIVNMFIMMNEARLLCGIQGESQANLAYELTLQYAKERSQFKTPIANLADVKRMLLNMRARARGMRALSLFTANLFDLEKSRDPLNDKNLLAFMTPICKSYCSELGFDVTIDAIQVHGGYGYCSEYGIEQFARDTKIATIYEGTNGIQALDLVMRKILKDEGKTFLYLAQLIEKTMNEAKEEKWTKEISLLKSSLDVGQKILGKFGKLANEKKIDSISYFCSDFLNYCGNLITAWLLLRHAVKANCLLEEGEKGDLEFLKSKSDDFKVFCQSTLSLNSGIASSILECDDDFMSIEI